MAKPRFKYRCKKCGIVTEHKQLKVLQAFCPTCKRITMQRLAEASKPPAAPGTKPPPVALGQAKPTTVAVEHVPLILEPEPGAPGEPATPGELAAPGAPGELAAPGAPGEPAAPAGEPAMLSDEAWSDIYGMPAETLSVALAAPQLRLSDETCRTQGVRIARFCQRHNIVLPPYMDALPIVGRALQDYGLLLRAASIKMKERRSAAPAEESSKTGREKSGGIEVPESTVEHVSAEAPPDIDDRIQKALSERR